MLKHLHRNIPGVEVDDATFARMHGRGQGGGAWKFAVDVIDRLRSIPDVAGVHLMAPGWGDRGSSVDSGARRTGVLVAYEL